MATASHQSKSVSTIELYNSWAETYDHDSNPLQAIDSLCLPSLLHPVLAHLSSSSSSSLVITELGCGTGRNTLSLLTIPLPQPLKISHIHALDFSPSMLAIAQSRYSSFLSSSSTLSNPPPPISFHQFNALNPSTIILHQIGQKADIILTTLVLEHLHLPAFFSVTKSLLKPNEPGKGKYLVLTNMHPEMGRRTQAGFMDGDKTKIQGESFIHSIEEVLLEGKKHGFVVWGEQGVMEKRVGEEDIVGVNGREGLGERGRKWMGCKVWFGVVMEFVGEE